MVRPERSVRETDNANRTLDDVWSGTNGLAVAIENIFNLNFDKNSYMFTYTNVYDYCTASRSTTGDSARQIQRGSRRGQNQQSSSGFIGAELYDKLTKKIKSKVEFISELGLTKFDRDLLAFYCKSWREYEFSIKVLNGVCGYLNRHWVARERDERGDDAETKVYVIRDLGIIQWKDIFYGKQSKQLVKEILKVIESERNDETQQDNTELLKTIIQESFVALGLKKALIEKNKPVNDLSVYESGFEREFLKETKEYYRRESSEFIADNTVVQYLIKVEQRFKEEQKRVRNYLDESTAVKIESVLVDVLIKDHIQRIYDEFKILLQQNKIGDLSRLYYLVKKTENHRSKADEYSILDPMRKSFQEHITLRGREAIAKVKATALSDPKSYVDTILEVHRTYHSLVTSAFENDSGFATSLDRAASDFVNANVVCEAKANRSAELLAKYCDSILKKSNKASEDIDKKLSEIIIVYKFITDKDIFLEFYSKLFGNRLVKESSASEDHEQTMILKLKDESGYEFTAKLQKMFQDISLSKSLNEDFRKFSKELTHIPLDFQIKVLTTNSWPYKPSSDFKLPTEIQKCKDRFIDYYFSKHNGRKISWIWTQCRGDIKYTPTGVSYSYIFTTTTHQMAVLLLFNSTDELSVNELAAETQIETENDYLYKVLATLLKVKLLICKNRTLTEDELVNSDDTIICNHKYKSKKKKMNISMPIKAEIKQESDATIKKVEEDRGLSIQAAVVRIMKTRKRSDHSNLLAEVMAQLQSRFKPKVLLIKKQIEILVEKEYLTRVEGERNIYEYVA